MSNPLFNALGGNQANMLNQFRQFMDQMRDKNPHQEIAKLLQSGRITQQQLNEAQQMAQQIQGLFGMIKK